MNWDNSKKEFIPYKDCRSCRRTLPVSDFPFKNYTRTNRCKDCTSGTVEPADHVLVVPVKDHSLHQIVAITVDIYKNHPDWLASWQYLGQYNKDIYDGIYTPSEENP